MRRQDKIKLLKGIAAGRKTIDEILPPIIRIWMQDKTDPDLLHCEAEGITRRRDEIEKSLGYVTLKIEK